MAWAEEGPSGKPSADGKPPQAVTPFDAAAAKKHQTAWAGYLRQPVELADSVGIKLKLIPPGEFEMGETTVAIAASRQWPYEEATRNDEGPQHLVRITRPFYLGVYHVTRGQFQQFVAANHYKTEAESNGKGGWGYDVQGLLQQKPEYNWRNPGFAQSGEHAVVNVSWNDAVAFCHWLGRKEGKEYRLPTEAEWEYACRAGTRGLYGGTTDGGLVLPFEQQAPNGAAPYPGTCDPRHTAAIGCFGANQFGLFDMFGSTQQMCADWYAKDYYAASPRDDPQGPNSGTERVVRSGALGGGAGNGCVADSARRDRLPPAACFNLVGFRIVRVP